MRTTPCSSSVSSAPSTEEHRLNNSETRSDVNMEEQQIIQGRTKRASKPSPGKRIRFLQCPFCDKGFNRSTNLKRHISTHTGEKPFMCSVCNKRFIQRYQLNKHKCSPTRERPFSCSVCDCRFHRSYDLSYHMETHATETPCSSSFSSEEHRPNSDETRSDVNMDEQQIIQGRTKRASKPSPGKRIRFLQCPFCDKGFNRSTNLKRHISTHTGERPFRCSVCNKRFIQRYQLNKHKCSPTRERPFSCSVCDCRFHRSYDLSYHMETHATETPCSSSFSSEEHRPNSDETRSDVNVQVEQKVELQVPEVSVWSEEPGQTEHQEDDALSLQREVQRPELHSGAQQ
uniref:C2H2-type domain-containing protein n=1 Tax=Neogobius melanostomus TaxID=47308 RepID=A0A8C6TS27_9GOBI